MKTGVDVKYIPWALLLTLVLWWCINEWMHRTTNHDLFWLFTGFERLQAGQSMTEGFYETNPPLSAFVYAPAFLFVKMKLVTLGHGVLIYGMVLLGLSVAATHGIIRHWDFLKPAERILICAMLTIAGTIMVSPEFGQRDHLLTLGAVPLICLLLSRTWGFPVNAALSIVLLVIGTVLLLVKPYYGILPAFLMIHRMISRRNILAAFDYDFLIMAFVTFLYALSICFFFPDYLTQILPDLPKLYGAAGARFNIPVSFLLLFFWMCVCTATVWLKLEKRKLSYIRILLVCAGLSFIIYILMNKGYTYHLVPFLTFTLLATALLLQQCFSRKGHDSRSTMPYLGIVLAGLVGSVPQAFYPSPAIIQAQEVTQVVTDCGDDCRFLMMGAPVRAIQHISYYAGKPHVSRFSKMWFVEGLLINEISDPGNPETLMLRKKYAGFVATDMYRYKPDIILSCHDFTDHIQFMSISPDFVREIGNYRHVRTLPFYPQAFFRKAQQQPFKNTPCELYKRK